MTYPMCFHLLDKLYNEHGLSLDEWETLIDGFHPAVSLKASEMALELRHRYYDYDVYIRGLIELTNYCKNDCFYCGIRKSNRYVSRYRLDKKTILSCCLEGYALGFRTFVLQGGEDGFFTDRILEDIIVSIKTDFPDCAVTLSLGERSRESYLRLYHAGADRYLLRHETFNAAHYRRLHPPELSASERQQCLWNLKEIGFQVGCGFMVGAPGQTSKTLAEDMLFIQDLRPHMVGIGPFIPHRETPFAKSPPGDVGLTLYLLSLIRVLIPGVLLPATTALGSLAKDGRRLGILAGANVVMPNLSPMDCREKYALYDNKAFTGCEAAQGLSLLSRELETIGYHIAVHRGDSKNI